MAMEEYWIGEGVDYDRIWRDFDSGAGYIDKFRSMDAYLLRITFSQPPSDLPLFNHDAIFKTVKGYYHDLKRACLTPDEYGKAGPLFLYSIDRASSIWEFLGEIRQLLLLGTTLADEKVMGEKLSNLDKRLELYEKLFGKISVSAKDYQAFMTARTPKQLDKAIRRIFDEGIEKVEISTIPFVGAIQEARKTLVDIKALDAPK
jgi:hypothetical protein